MTIGRKIIGGYAVVLGLLLAAVGMAFYATTTIQHRYDEFLDVRERLVSDAQDFGFELRDQIAHYRGLLLYPEEQKTYWDELQKDHQDFAEVVELMRKRLLTEEGRRLLDEIARLQAGHEAAQEKVVALAQQGKRAEALALGIKEVRPLTGQLVDKVGAFRERQMRLEAEGRAATAATVRRLSLATAGVALLAVAAGLAIGLLLTRSITRQLREAISQLSSSSAEIVATTTQVASGAAETATAVGETTTTVAEVKQTAEVASQKARYVSEAAQKAAQVSQTGRASVEAAIEGMQRIRGLMESVGESIVRLSEQSGAIGEIIATVNDVAEQSNLLAVNAAIEAAKAGEHGKGFAVVAHEVKSLAQQSRQATAQVRAILNDIQKATSTAVMATEQGSKGVAAGVKQSTESGEAIRTLADSIAEAAQAATQIAASSQQQLVGMDQVALAMENINQASAQNLAGTKQAETAAQDLQVLAQKLTRLVIGGGPASPLAVTHNR